MLLRLLCGGPPTVRARCVSIHSVLRACDCARCDLVIHRRPRPTTQLISAVLVSVCVSFYPDLVSRWSDPTYVIGSVLGCQAIVACD